MDNDAAIDRFATLARAFCQWVETGRLDGDDAVLQARRHFSALYSAALDLPLGEPCTWPGAPDTAELGEVERIAVATRLRAFPIQYYHQVTARPEEPEGLRVGDANDDLFDTYCDIKEGLSTLEQGDRPLAALNWRASFDMHWGYHVACGLKALHEFEPVKP